MFLYIVLGATIDNSGLSLMGGGLTSTHGGTAGLSSGKHQDFTYKKFWGLEITGADFGQSLFSGAVFEKCIFKEVGFDRCDFAGTTFANCTFVRCTFVPAELRSCFIVDSRFESCDFGGAQWDRTQVERTIFTAVSFEGASVREATFSTSTFSSCIFQKASVTLDRFASCTFNETDLANCTALFLFFDGCSFLSSKINAQTLGFTFGLTRQNLQDLSLLHLGVAVEKLPDDGHLIDNLITTYQARKWYVGAAALRLNFSQDAPIIVVRDLVGELHRQLADSRADWDELQFLSRLLQRLAGEGRLPLLALWSLVQLIQTLREQMDREFPSAIDHAPGPELVLGRLNSLLNGQLEETGRFFDALGAASNDVCLRWTLTEQPARAIDRLIPWSAFRSFGTTKITLVKASTGSWIEIWHTSVGALVAIQIALSCVTGITSQLVKSGTNLRKVVGLFMRDRLKSPKKKALPTLRNSFAGRKRSVQPLDASLQIFPSPERLVVIDAVFRRLMNMSDEELRLFTSYDGDHTQGIEIEKITRRLTHKRRSSASAKRARPPSPASSKRKRLIRKAKP